jgi:hypothetical protein
MILFTFIEHRSSDIRPGGTVSQHAVEPVRIGDPPDPGCIVSQRTKMC